MKKNRNSFFSENNMNYMGYNPGFNGYQSAYNSNFYSGPINNQMGQNLDMSDVLDRLAKLERQYNRLDHRISNLESNKYKSTDDFESNNNNMYMI